MHGRALKTSAEAQALSDFFAAQNVPALTSLVARAVETINVRAAWYERDKDDIATWLETH